MVIAVQFTNINLINDRDKMAVTRKELYAVHTSYIIDTRLMFHNEHNQIVHVGYMMN